MRTLTVFRNSSKKPGTYQLVDPKPVAVGWIRLRRAMNRGKHEGQLRDGAIEHSCNWCMIKEPGELGTARQKIINRG